MFILKAENGSLKLKKINKSTIPNVLSEYHDKNPNGNWDGFRSFNRKQNYKTLKGIIFSDQGYLCAYCETSLRNAQPEEKRIEHFHSKAGASVANVNLDLQWENLIGVCLGGSDIIDKTISKADKIISYYRCDTHKAHLENIGEIDKYKTDRYLNPLELCTNSLLDLDRDTLFLIPNKQNCQLYTPSENFFNTTEELVLSTIKVFNLNCSHLIAKRRAIYDSYQVKMIKAKGEKNLNIKKEIASQWFSTIWPELFTTKRIILGGAAEDYLNEIKYDG